MELSLDSILSLDWDERGKLLPDNFQPIEAMVLIKGVYVEGEDMTRPVWVHKLTAGLTQNSAEVVGELDIAHALARQQAIAEFDEEDD
jgi:hypothetical protein